jgi:hypothetical protein
MVLGNIIVFSLIYNNSLISMSSCSLGCHLIGVVVDVNRVNVGVKDVT